MNIYQRLNEVRKKVSYLQKKKEVQGYKVITHDEVTASIRDPFIKHGIITVPFQTDSNVVDVGRTKSGATIIRYSGWYDIQFTNVDEPTDSVCVAIEAHAMDQGDKAPGKALSYAVKYAMLKILNIETGEDEEGRIEVSKKPLLHPDHIKWQDAVDNVAAGKVTVDKIKKHWELEAEDEKILRSL